MHVPKAVTQVAFPSNAEHAHEAELDLAIVRRVQAGDVAAFDQLVRQYRERLFGVIYNLTANREDAADILQDVFIKSFQSINRFRCQSSFFTWLYKIALNTTYTHLRRSRLRRFFSLETMDEAAVSAEIQDALGRESGAERSSFLKELQEKLNEALQRLSIKHRTVVVLFEVEGLSHAEIASITGTTEGTVRSRLHYAKQVLQGYLKDYIRHD